MTMPDGVRLDDQPATPAWGVSEHSLLRWPQLQPGTHVEVAKWSAKHQGERRALYPGVVVGSPLPSPWIVIETYWTMGAHDQGLLTFENGDLLHEIFSPIHPYNAFAVYAPDGLLKGWYANVTYPTFFEEGADERVLVWHDLFIDIVATPDGEVAVLDEDELEDAGLLATDPDLHARILAARDELLQRLRDRQAPFYQTEVRSSDAGAS